MKNLVLIIAVVMAVGCKKDYTCRCLANPNGGDYTYTVIKSSHSKAKKECESKTSWGKACELQ